MSAECCAPESKVEVGKRRTTLWIALILNFVMFCVEIGASFFADSLSLRADAIDFLGDAANYGISLTVLGLSLRSRAFASIGKATTMGLFGVWVIISAIYNAVNGSYPHAEAMGALGFIALLVNLSVALMLYRFKDGDSNMQSVWLCSRNDAIGNIAVMLAGGGVYLLSSHWPDLAVAMGMGALSLQSCYLVFRAAKSELRTNQQ